MHILFVDESGSAPEADKAASQPFFVLGGIVIPEDIWAKMAADLARVKEHYAIEGEIKWRNFAPEKGGKPHALSHMSAEQKDLLRVRIYEVIRRYKSVRLICVVANTAEAFERGYVKSADDLYWYSYKMLTERFQYYLQDLERVVGQKLNGMVVCDHRGPKDDARLRELHHKLVNGKGGCDFVLRQHDWRFVHRAVPPECGHSVCRHGGGCCFSCVQGGRHAFCRSDPRVLPNLPERGDRGLWFGEVPEELVRRGDVDQHHPERRRRVEVAPNPAVIGAVTA